MSFFDSIEPSGTLVSAGASSGAGASGAPEVSVKPVIRLIERTVFGSRWLVMPFLFGLIVGLAALLVKFVAKLVDLIVLVYGAADLSEVLVAILGLVDLTLTANLILIVICSSYDNFIAPVGDHPEWPQGLVKIGFSGLKQKLLASIVAITAVSVLEWFMDIDRQPDGTKLVWVVAMLLAFATTALILAAADRLAGGDNA
jgi:uncharacterized protein (TIGR00645 family)